MVDNVIIYGASDDLVEVEYGKHQWEFTVNDDDACELRIEDDDGKSLMVRASFTPDGWDLAVAAITEIAPTDWTVEFYTIGKETDPAIAITPDGPVRVTRMDDFEE